jgi:hypothetical protein
MCSEMNNHVDTQEWKVNNRFAVSRIVVLLMESYPNYPSGMLHSQAMQKESAESTPNFLQFILPLPSVLLREIPLGFPFAQFRAGIETLFLVVQESLRKNHVQPSC